VAKAHGDLARHDHALEQVWPDAINTGALTRNTPTLDLDIMHEPAAVAVEEFIGEYFEERGPILVRFGKAPKRAILFPTDTPFRKITAPLIAPNGITKGSSSLPMVNSSSLTESTPTLARPIVGLAACRGTSHAINCRTSILTRRNSWSRTSSKSSSASSGFMRMSPRG
jgi:hypothetical protein